MKFDFEWTVYSYTHPQAIDVMSSEPLEKWNTAYGIYVYHKAGESARIRPLLNSVRIWC